MFLRVTGPKARQAVDPRQTGKGGREDWIFYMPCVADPAHESRI